MGAEQFGDFALFTKDRLIGYVTNRIEGEMPVGKVWSTLNRFQLIEEVLDIQKRCKYIHVRSDFSSMKSMFWISNTSSITLELAHH